MALVNLKEMLARASAEHYAVGMFDVSDLEMIRHRPAGGQKETLI